MWDQLSCPECPTLLGYADVQKYASKETFEKYDSLTMKTAAGQDPNFRWCTAAGCSSGQVHPDGAAYPLIICNSCRSLSCFTHQCPWHEGMTCLDFDNPEATFEWSEQMRKDRKLAIHLLKEEEENMPSQGGRHKGKRPVRAEDSVQRGSKRHGGEAQRRKGKERERKVHHAQEVRIRQRNEESATEELLRANTTACPGGCGWRIEKNDGCDHMTCAVSDPSI